MFDLLLGLQAYWVGCAPTTTAGKQRVYFANHQSHLDTIAIREALPKSEKSKTRPIAAIDYWGKGLGKIIAERFFNAILVERHHITKESSPLLPIQNALERGDSLIIFPEGTRGAGNTIGEFKTGIYHIAKLRPQSAFVPVYLRNLNRILPRGEWLPLPLCANIYFGEEIFLQPDESRDGFTQRCRSSLIQLCNQSSTL